MTIDSAPDISIIVLNFNTCTLTRACIESLYKSQGCFTQEIIVVDNASTDDSLATLRSVFPAIQVIANSENVGYGRGNNAGLQIAQGRYLLCLNSDTLVQENALSQLLNFMDAHPDAGACSPMLLNEDGSLQPTGQSLPTLWSMFINTTKLYRLWKADLYQQLGRNYEKVAEVGEISGAAMLIRRETYKNVGGFDESFFAYYEDVDLCKRIGDAGNKIYYVPTAKITHLWKRSSQRVPALSYRAGQDSLKYYFLKHHGSLAHNIIRLLLTCKEALLILNYTLKQSQEDVQFHWQMLRNIWSATK